jgi:hypothetical protein
MSPAFFLLGADLRPSNDFISLRLCPEWSVFSLWRSRSPLLALLRLLLLGLFETSFCVLKNF